MYSAATFHSLFGRNATLASHDLPNRQGFAMDGLCLLRDVCGDSQIYFILAERENHEVFSFVEESPFLTLVFQCSVE